MVRGFQKQKARGQNKYTDSSKYLLNFITYSLVIIQFPTKQES